MLHHHKFLRCFLLKNWSLVNSFYILVVVKVSSEGVTLSFDINWWTLKLIITLFRFRTAEIRKMNFRRWIRRWNFRITTIEWSESNDVHTECNKESWLLSSIGFWWGGKKKLFCRCWTKLDQVSRSNFTILCPGNGWELGLPYFY